MTFHNSSLANCVVLCCVVFRLCVAAAEKEALEQNGHDDDVDNGSLAGQPSFVC